MTNVLICQHILMCRCLCSQWQSWHSTRLWFPGELCVAGDNQRDRGEAVLPLQPWKPGHILRGTAVLTQLVFAYVYLVKVLFTLCCHKMWRSCFTCALSVVSFLAIQREYGVCAEVWASVQLAGQCEETKSTPLLYQLSQQMEPACILSTTVHITSMLSVHAIAFT